MCFFCGNPLYAYDESTYNKSYFYLNFFQISFYPSDPLMGQEYHYLFFSSSFRGLFVFTKLGAWTIYGILKMKGQFIVESLILPPLHAYL